MIVGTNSVAMPGTFFAHLLKDYGYALARFQIEQPAVGELVLRYVPAARFHPRVLDELFEDHRGTGSEQKVSFGLLVQLVADALLEHRGSGPLNVELGAGRIESTVYDAAGLPTRSAFGPVDLDVDLRVGQGAT